DISGPVVIEPGVSFSISCKFSGFSISSYCLGWIRQAEGKALEHVGLTCRSSASTVDTLKSKITSRYDSSSSTVFLQGNNFQTEDTAVYYCARRHSGTNHDQALQKPFLHCSL
uniref:Immunoglobulin heavy variable 7-1 n=1 Tax=Oncorhynchus kisutch TaxID=8019 RepID=A0A8C7JDK2_ONCKI